MKRVFLGVAVVGLTAIAVWPAMVIAQGFPPPPPSTYYGTVSGGGAVGQGVVAIVSEGGVQQTCGDGTVLQDGGNLVYVIDVIQDGQKLGCGKAGRTIQFYFTPTAGSGGRLANGSTAWQDPGAPHQVNLTLGTELAVKGRAQAAARDGIN